MKKIGLLAFVAVLCIGTSAMATYSYYHDFSTGAAGFDQSNWVLPDGYEVGNVGPDWNNAFVIQGGGLDGYPAYCSNARAASAHTAMQFGPGTTVSYKMQEIKALYASGFLDRSVPADNYLNNLLGFRADQAGNDYWVNIGGSMYDTGITTTTGQYPYVNFLIDWQPTYVRFVIDRPKDGAHYDHTFNIAITTSGNFDVSQNAQGRLCLDTINITSVPEPATMSLLALAGLGLLRKKA